MKNRHFPDQIINRTRRWPRDIAKQSPSYILGCSPTPKKTGENEGKSGFCPINISWCLVLTGILAHPNMYCEVMQPAEIVILLMEEIQLTTWDVKNPMENGTFSISQLVILRISEPSTVLDAVEKKLGMDFSCFTSNHLSVLSTPSKEKHLGGGIVPFKMLHPVGLRQAGGGPFFPSKRLTQVFLQLIDVPMSKPQSLLNFVFSFPVLFASWIKMRLSGLKNLKESNHSTFKVDSTYITSWWFQPIPKIWSSNWIISPVFGVKRKIFEVTPRTSVDWKVESKFEAPRFNHSGPFHPPWESGHS